MQMFLVVYSSASGVILCVFCRGTVFLEPFSQPSPPSSHNKYVVRIFCFHCLFSVMVPGGCHSQGCHEYPVCVAQIACGSTILLGTIPTFI